MGVYANKGVPTFEVLFLPLVVSEYGVGLVRMSADNWLKHAAVHGIFIGMLVWPHEDPALMLVPVK